ncbi:MAG: rhodanese-like domain-containing protein [Chloroflexi bacterium]|nr:rhodanese-like domain-containing protein [Chloroflexota bacterium]
MKGPRAWALVAAIGLLLLAACGGGDSASNGGEGNLPGKDAGGFRRLTAVELDAMLKAEDVPLVNVHIPYEGELAGTGAFIPFDHIAEELDQLPADKSAKIVLYCRSGRMSTEAAQALVLLGYTNVWELGGGMIAWEKAGFEVLQKPR